MDLQEELALLLEQRTESLAVEFKRWIDPDTKEDAAKIAKGCIALRNNNGGYFVIGFDEKTHELDIKNRPADVRAVYNQDRIQGIVSRYASQQFECEVHFVSYREEEYPVVRILGGVKTPVATRADLKNDSQALIKNNRLYVRTLNANNTPSTSEATHKDWDRIVEICYDNRDADIARFVSRHLTSVEGRRVTITVEKDTAGTSNQIEKSELSVARVTSSPTLKTTKGFEAVEGFEHESFGAFEHKARERQLGLPPHGSFQVTAITNIESHRYSTNHEFLDALASRNPNYTGWPLWVDSRNFRDSKSTPFVWKGCWQALMFSFGEDRFNHVDFWRIDPKGLFYHYRALEDDLKTGTRAPQPMRELDFGMPIWRVGEAIAIAASYGRAILDEEAREAKLLFRFRWTGLKDRVLSSWADPSRFINPFYVTRESEIISQIEVPVNLPLSSLPDYTYRVVRPLFNSFSGCEISMSVVSELVNKMLSRRR